MACTDYTAIGMCLCTLLAPNGVVYGLADKLLSLVCACGYCIIMDIFVSPSNVLLYHYMAYSYYHLASLYVSVCLYHLVQESFRSTSFIYDTNMHIHPHISTSNIGIYGIYAQFGGHNCFWYIVGNNIWSSSCIWLCLEYICQNVESTYLCTILLIWAILWM